VRCGSGSVSSPTTPCCSLRLTADRYRPMRCRRRGRTSPTTSAKPDVIFHALRHTHASQLIDAHVDIVTISKRLGHAKPDTTLRVYAHLFRKDDGKAAAAINAALGG
jgi:integrase